MANGYIHKGTIIGKLKGVIPATTPKGYLQIDPSIPVAILGKASPNIKLGVEVACSTTSIPRWTSPLESFNALPFSCVRIWASSSLFSSSNCKYLKRSEEHTSELQSRGHLVC